MQETTKNPLIEKLRNETISLCKERGINQTQIVKGTSIPQACVSDFLTGKRGLSGEATLKLQQFMCEVQAQPKEAEKSA